MKNNFNKEFYKVLEEKIFPYFEGINSCHDFDHSKRVLNIALSIGEKENADLNIIKISALLHDIGRQKQDESKGKFCHAEEGAKMAREILEEFGLDKDLINSVVHCIETHRFRKGNPPLTKEAKVIYDADKLDGIGAIGILRATSFSGFLGAKVHNPHVDIETTLEYGNEDSAYREYLVKLVKVKNKMLTEEGKKLAEERDKFMHLFFNRANKEVEGEL